MNKETYHHGDLRNDLIIGEYKFNIEEADINIVTGKVTLVLSNKI